MPDRGKSLEPRRLSFDFFMARDSPNHQAQTSAQGERTPLGMPPDLLVEETPQETASAVPNPPFTPTNLAGCQSAPPGYSQPVYTPQTAGPSGANAVNSSALNGLASSGVTPTVLAGPTPSGTTPILTGGPTSAAPPPLIGPGMPPAWPTVSAPADPYRQMWDQHMLQSWGQFLSLSSPMLGNNVAPIPTHIMQQPGERLPAQQACMAPSRSGLRPPLYEGNMGGIRGEHYQGTPSCFPNPQGHAIPHEKYVPPFVGGGIPSGAPFIQTQERIRSPSHHSTGSVTHSPRRRWHDDTADLGRRKQCSPARGVFPNHFYHHPININGFTNLPRFSTKTLQCPKEFLSSFKARISLSTLDRSIWCRVFPTCLEESAWKWFSELPFNSVRDFADLESQFLQRFPSIRAPAKRSIDLMSLKQDERESTRKFLNRFAEEANQTIDYNDGIILAAVRQGLRQGSALRWRAVEEDFRTFAEFRTAAEKTLQAEEDAAVAGKPASRGASRKSPDRPRRYPRPASPSNRRSTPPSTRRDTPPRPYRRGRSFNKYKGVVAQPRFPPTGEDYKQGYTNYHVFSVSTDSLLQVVQDDPEFKRPEPLSREETNRGDRNKYCRYHNGYGHATSECIKLKDEIERMIRNTKVLERYLETPQWNNEERGNRGGRQGNNYGRRMRDRGRQAERTRQRTPPNADQDNPRPSPAPVLYIAGGPAAGGDSERARRRYAYPKNLDNPSRMEVFQIGESNSVANTRITFGPEDYAGIHLPHDDAIVVMLRVNGTLVGRILIDTGSSADIIYYETLKKLHLQNHPLKPMATPLTGFTGDQLMPLGVIDLPVVFGESPRDVVSRVSFVVVNTPSPYNIILGRKALNDIGAIASTPHLKVKFPTRSGVGTLRGEQQVARTCYQASIPKHVAQIEHASERTESYDSAENILLHNPAGPTGGPMEDTEEFDLGDGKITKIGTVLSGEDRELVKACLLRNRDLFACEGEAMPGIDREIAEHQIVTKPGMRPITQKKRKQSREKRRAIKAEVEKLLKTGAIREVKYPQWLANPVLVTKSNGQWRMCIDYTDLNKACPKTPFPLPSIDAMIDSTAGFKYLSFMDAYSGYNQIRISQADEEKTSFVTEEGLYCYKVMPFGLKNAGAEYQKMVSKVFKEELGEIMEAYIDDMVVKSGTGSDHVAHLERVFAKMRQVGMRLNSKKSFFCLSSGKFLGFIISERGIEAHPDKCQAVINLKSPSSIKEVQGLTGRIAALSRFISQSAMLCKPFFDLIKKKTQGFEWGPECQEAFGKIKEYLSTPPIISRPINGEPLYLYIATNEEAISTALVREEEGVQKPVYFVSRVLRDAETRYPTIEKNAFAIVVTARKLRPYFQAHPIRVVTTMPLRKALGQFNVAGRLLKWAIELSEFDITYLSRTAYKSQALADFIVQGTSGDFTPVESVWEVYVDGASSDKGTGLGVEIISPDGDRFKYALRVNFNPSHNVAEYEAFIAGLQLVAATGAKNIRIRSDSQLVVNQVLKEYKTQDETLIKYLRKVEQLIGDFDKVLVEHIPRGENETADALSKLAKSELDKERPIIVLEIPSPSIQLLEMVVFQTRHEEEWYSPIWMYLTKGILPQDRNLARKIKRWSLEFTIVEEELCKKGYHHPWLICVGRAKADELLKETHQGICGSHQGPRTLGKRIMRQGYYWPSLRRDAEDLVRRCAQCQFHARISHMPPNNLKPITSPWPFDIWGMDILGPFPQARGNLKFIVVAVEYFTKWIEAKALSLITSQKITDFLEHQIVYRYGIPNAIITDNGRQFTGAPFKNYCRGLGIDINFAFVCHPQSNGLAEVSNRTILEGLKKKIEGTKNTWPEYLSEVVWAYNTTPRSATERSPYALVYGMEAVIPMEIVHPTLRTINYSTQRNAERRMEELEVIHELREEASARQAEYQRKMRRAFDKKVAPRHFQPGDLVLRKAAAAGKHIGKMDPVWDGPFEIVKSAGERAFYLKNAQGKVLANSWNASDLRKFYP
ncbi:hypothetical protein LUZ61_004894 [Rhynchospora tenuis]|uniref:Uncharacterized protein n=1 Tax=Rhynchospora tenuis TaxID=198213 RepID=A0AAD5ZNY4_9POAL|nr:hypothetical protein LUZ61_004894 [Rhynchospora tenuis]